MYKQHGQKATTPGRAPEPPPQCNTGAGTPSGGDGRRSSSRIASAGQPVDEYSILVMGSIQQQYQTDGEDAYSLETRVHTLCEHAHLDKRDIMDVGLRVGTNGRVVSQERFIVKEPLLIKITNVVAQLQELCTASANALKDKKRGYTIDPENTMLPVLSGAKSVGDLERAWRLLIQRLSRAQDKLDRNFKIYKQEDVPPHSPATTDPRIYEEVQSAWEPEEMMTHLYRQVPSMSRLLTEEEHSKLELGQDLRNAILSPLDLKSAFPDRAAEPHPTEVYYDENGAKITTADPDALIPRRTSNIASNHPRFEFTDSDSVSQARPGQQRRAWGRASDRGYETAPTSMVHPASPTNNQWGLLEGISSAYQRFTGSSQNWAPSRLAPDPARREIDITEDVDRRPLTARTSYCIFLFIQIFPHPAEIISCQMPPILACLQLASMGSNTLLLLLIRCV